MGIWVRCMCHALRWDAESTLAKLGQGFVQAPYDATRLGRQGLAAAPWGAPGFSNMNIIYFSDSMHYAYIYIICNIYIYISLCIQYLDICSQRFRWDLAEISILTFPVKLGKLIPHTDQRIDHYVEVTVCIDNHAIEWQWVTIDMYSGDSGVHCSQRSASALCQAPPRSLLHLPPAEDCWRQRRQMVMSVAPHLHGLEADRQRWSKMP